MQNLEKCPFCGATLTGKWSAPAFSICDACGLVLRNPMPTVDDLALLYEEAWLSPCTNVAETGGMTDVVADQLAESFLRTVGLTGRPGACVLDFGAGRGAFLSALRRRTIRAVGVEPYGLSWLQDNSFEAYRCLADVPADLKFDAIYCSDVVEHLHTPWNELAELRRWLKPGASICISTPNPHGLNAKVHGYRWREAANPGHLLFMTPQVMANMLRHAGFTHIRPIRWAISYRKNPLANAFQKALTALRLNGTTRVIASG